MFPHTFREDVPIESLVDDGDSESFLLVLQTKKQKEWLLRYGNDVTCMDAIHKTVKYGFPCFFLVVRTSIGIGRVVGTIIYHNMRTRNSSQRGYQSSRNGILIGNLDFL